MYAEPQTIADALGIKGPGITTSMMLVESIVGGLPVASLDHLSKLVCPQDAEFKFSFVAKATLSRRKKGHTSRLTSEESDRLARIAKVWAHAKDIWKDDEDTRWFLFQPHQLLDGKKPIDVALSSEIGADFVDQILGRLEFGSAA